MTRPHLGVSLLSSYRAAQLATLAAVMSIGCVADNDASLAPRILLTSPSLLTPVIDIQTAVVVSEWAEAEFGEWIVDDALLVESAVEVDNNAVVWFYVVGTDGPSPTTSLEFQLSVDAEVVGSVLWGS